MGIYCSVLPTFVCLSFFFLIKFKEVEWKTQIIDGPIHSCGGGCSLGSMNSELTSLPCT